MHIAICDDESFFREHLRKLLLNYSFQENIDIHISEYAGGETLLAACSEGPEKNMDVLFLDIRMDGTDGMETARLLRAQGCKCLIVFLTSLTEYVQKGYEVKAFRYLLKEQMSNELGRVMDACRQELGTEEYFSFSYERCSYRIPRQDILYFESRKRLIVIHGRNGMYRFYQKLDVLENQLAGVGFLRCHRSFLVQERYIRSWKENALWLEDGTEIPISRTYEREVNHRLMVRAGE